MLRDPIRLLVLLFGSTLCGGALGAGINLIAHPATQNGGPAFAGLLAGFGFGLLLAAHRGDA